MLFWQYFLYKTVVKKQQPKSLDDKSQFSYTVCSVARVLLNYLGAVMRDVYIIVTDDERFYLTQMPENFVSAAAAESLDDLGEFRIMFGDVNAACRVLKYSPEYITGLINHLPKNFTELSDMKPFTVQ